VLKYKKELNITVFLFVQDVGHLKGVPHLAHCFVNLLLNRQFCCWVSAPRLALLSLKP